MGSLLVIPACTLCSLTRSAGSTAPLLTVYPSKTFPNHWSIVTGLFPAWSGVIANSFQADTPAGRKTFTMATTDPWFWLGEPAWVTAQRAGRKALTAGWPGSEVPLTWPGGAWNTSAVPPYGGPTGVGFKSPSQRVDAVLATYADPAGAPDFQTLYLNNVDDMGHAAGPDSGEVEGAVATVDAALWRLFQGLNASGMLGRMHIIVVSDHGMAPTSNCNHTLPAASLLAPGANISALLAGGAELNGPFVGLTCPGCSLAEARALADESNAAAQAQGITQKMYRAYAKQDLPAGPGMGSYGASDRVWPVVGLMGLGYTVTTRARNSCGGTCGGTHGFEPRFGAMNAIFAGVGPRFPPGVAMTPVTPGAAAGAALPNTEVYGLLMALLGVRPAATNGTAGYPGRALLPRC